MRDLAPLGKLLWVRRKGIITEFAAALAVIFASLVGLAHIATTGWLKLFLFDSDSLTLPVLQQSLARKEEILWVFSSQLNLFPEGILYAFSTFFANSVSAVLAVNAVINILLFYIIVRLIFMVALPLSGTLQRLYSLVCVLLLLAYTLLESYSPTINQTMSTFFLFNTYYQGLVLIGLLALFFILLQLRHTGSIFDKKNILLSLITLLMSSLAIASNPLYVPQFTAPFIAAFGVFFLLKLADHKQLVFLAATQLVSFGLGMFIRSFLGGFIGMTVGQHSAPQAKFTVLERISFALGSLAPLHPTVTTALRLFAAVLIYFMILLFLLVRLNRRLKKNSTEPKPLAVFTLVFVALQPIVIVVTTSIMSGLQNRYLITAVIVPLVGFVMALAMLEVKKIRIYANKLFWVLAVMSVIAALPCLPKLKVFANAKNPQALCLAKSLGDKPAVGIAGYWTSRPLDVYGNGKIRVLQAQSFTPYAWLNNLASYKHQEYSFVLEPRSSDDSKDMQLPVVNILGTPSKITPCPRFYIHQYAPGSEGYKHLNQSMNASLETQLEYRQKGKIAEYNQSRTLRLFIEQ